MINCNSDDSSEQLEELLMGLPDMHLCLHTVYRAAALLYEQIKVIAFPRQNSIPRMQAQCRAEVIGSVSAVHNALIGSSLPQSLQLIAL